MECSRAAVVQSKLRGREGWASLLTSPAPYQKPDTVVICSRTGLPVEEGLIQGNQGELANLILPKTPGQGPQDLLGETSQGGIPRPDRILGLRQPWA